MTVPFWDVVTVGAPDTCWVWHGPINHHGYGRFGHKLAHRISYEIAHGPIPDGLFVLHRCDNRPCVNPTHLWLGTKKDNTLDCIQKGRFVDPIGGIRNRMKTHCNHGHEFTPENTWLYDGRRRCRTCRRRCCNAYNAKRPGRRKITA